MQTQPKRRGRGCLIAVLGVLGLCILLSALSAISNRNLPQAPTAGQLSELDKARLAEALNLKSRLGDSVWPGWGSARIPIIIWNDSYEFLMGNEGQPPAGWSVVEGDTFNGQAYFRKAAYDPQNFAVPLADDWAASMATKSATDAFLILSFRNIFPPPLKQIFPYRLLIQPSETQIAGLLHETFHVQQLRMAPERLQAAEAAHRQGGQYEQAAAEFSSEWKKENQLLANALDTKTHAEKAELVRQFLAARDQRRKSHALAPELVDYERWLEWEEGVGHYIELASLKAAAGTPGYAPVSAMQQDPDFKAYRGFGSRWTQEMIQLRYQTSQGEQRLYLAGMAEAFLLDDLLPGWKERYWGEGVFLEDLLRQATTEG